MKVWNKNGTYLDESIDKYTSGDDILLDQKLVKWDVIGSIAHTLMLEKQGLINSQKKETIMKYLWRILELDAAGDFILNKDQEDVHSNIEIFLGEHGKTLHTGRSRNDQIAVDLKLYMKDELIKISELLIKICGSLGNLSDKGWIMMPGYTHMQKAMPTTFSHYLLSYYELLVNDLEYLNKVYELLDKNPLGAGAGFGSLLYLDKDFTKERLGFSELEYNSLTAISSRGKNELFVLNVLQAIMLDLSKIAQDFLLFSTSEFGFISFGDSVTTGSSIMPQKKNIDVMEILKAKAKVVGGYQNSVFNICSGLMSGYNRDVQETKKPLMESVEIVQSSLHAMNTVLSYLKINDDNMKMACTKELFAADFTSILVEQKIPFREAYKKVGQDIDNFIDEDVMKNNLVYKKGKGEPGDKNMKNALSNKLDNLEKDMNNKKKKFDKAIEELIFSSKLS